MLEPAKLVGVVSKSIQPTTSASTKRSNSGLGWKRFKRSMIWAVGTLAACYYMVNETNATDDGVLIVLAVGGGVSIIYFLGMIVSWFK
jgi:hypothetical protein